MRWQSGERGAKSTVRRTFGPTHRRTESPQKAKRRATITAPTVPIEVSQWVIEGEPAKSITTNMDADEDDTASIEYARV